LSPPVSTFVRPYFAVTEGPIALKYFDNCFRLFSTSANTFTSYEAIEHSYWTVLTLGLLLSPQLPAQTNKTEPPKTNKTSVDLPRQELGSRRGKFVFEKRDNDKPINEADVASLSDHQRVGHCQIKDLTGLEKLQKPGLAGPLENQNLEHWPNSLT